MLDAKFPKHWKEEVKKKKKKTRGVLVIPYVKISQGNPLSKNNDQFLIKSFAR